MAVEQDNASGRVSYWDDRVYQSTADRNGISLAGYIHAMYGLVRQSGARDVLMIGCGGGTLATMLRRRTNARITIVDVDPLAFEIARRYFKLATDLTCHVADGLHYLAATGERYDAIVLDAYSEGAIPRQFLSNRFFALARSRLRPRNSLVLVNAYVSGPERNLSDRVADRMRASWRDVRILENPDGRRHNAIVAAGSVKRLRRPRLLLVPKSGVARLKRELAAMAFRT
jgi:spermidine synthase